MIDIDDVFAMPHLGREYPYLSSWHMHVTMMVVMMIRYQKHYTELDRDAILRIYSFNLPC